MVKGKLDSKWERVASFAWRCADCDVVTTLPLSSKLENLPPVACPICQKKRQKKQKGDADVS